MRTRKHYETMMGKNPNTSIGISLAAQAVYAAARGSFDQNAEDYDNELYRSIYLRLQRKYGESLSADEVKHEMAVSGAQAVIGKIKSPAKSASSAANGKKGGRPKGEEMTYELINHDGCLMDTVRTTSFRNAREYFSHNYEGKYVILCGEIDDRRNVVLK